ncbi:MAG: hypothetical protein JSS09_06485 [Verrucomicrobia bacterium]|nr:hypothetical protein [Verrucomicrobiota bacterium]
MSIPQDKIKAKEEEVFLDTVEKHPIVALIPKHRAFSGLEEEAFEVAKAVVAWLRGYHPNEYSKVNLFHDMGRLGRLELEYSRVYQPYVGGKSTKDKGFSAAAREGVTLPSPPEYAKVLLDSAAQVHAGVGLATIRELALKKLDIEAKLKEDKKKQQVRDWLAFQGAYHNQKKYTSMEEVD